MEEETYHLPHEYQDEREGGNEVEKKKKGGNEALKKFFPSLKTSIGVLNTLG